MKNNVLEFLEEINKKKPNKTALISGEKHISFSELRRKAVLLGEKIALFSGDSHNMPICIIAERDIDAIVCMLGCLYSGNYYVLVDSSLPETRIHKLIDSVDFLGVISCNGEIYNNSHLFFSETIAGFQIERAGLDCNFDEYVEKIIVNSRPFDPLYGIFTSGSTGAPKLVIKNHASMINFINSFVDMFDFEETDVLGNQLPFYFDASSKDLFCCLKCGITTHIIPKDYFSFPQSLIKYLIENEITIIIWVPSALSLVANADTFSSVGVPKMLKKVFFVGEQMPVKQLNYWKSNLPSTKFINLYGATEVAGNFLYFQYEEVLSAGDRLPTGKPFPNTRVFLLSSDNKVILEPECEGEICVISDTLSMGYYGDLELTAKVFVQNPFVAYREIMYKTGDLATYDSQGNIMWKSRRDYQIKHMGYRIELSEIEISIGSLPGVEACCCVYDEHNKRIILYYQAKVDLKKEIGKHIRKELPKYMYPSKYIRVDFIPHNANGKIDRKSLEKI